MFAPRFVICFALFFGAVSLQSQTFPASDASWVPIKRSGVVLTDPTISGSNISIAWHTAPGQQYQLESIGDLGATNWAAATAVTNAAGTNVSQTLPADAAHRFYRVVLLP